MPRVVWHGFYVRDEAREIPSLALDQVAV